MQKDSAIYARNCLKCQLHAPMIHQPTSELKYMTSPWPFAQWGMDIVGPLPTAAGNRKYLLVATDYFTKWIEAEPLANIRDADMIRFIWKSIITRFGIPRTIITDNGTQFESGPFQDFCNEHGIRHHFSSVAYPQSNGQAEASNKTVIAGLKKRLERAKGAWPSELPHVLWAYRTTPRRATGETPFSLTYGMEAIIPLEAGLPTMRSDLVEQGQNNEALLAELDLADERRESSMIKLASYQQQLARQYHKRVNPRRFQIGDYVVRKVLGNTVKSSDGKLGPNWEGPFKITRDDLQGAYHLETLEGREIPRAWNAANLKKFYY